MRRQKKIAVVGGGIFGLTIATVLGREGFRVDLFEKNDDILRAASGVNQFRLHRGYHYPRSIETIQSCIRGERKFRHFYPEVVIDHPHRHYYAIAREKSFLNARQCFAVWSSCGLEYTEENLELLNPEALEKCVRVKEAVIDPLRLKQSCLDNCRRAGVNIILGREVCCRDLDGYDHIVSATYAGSNALLEDFPESRTAYQFEVVEKLVLKLPERFRNISIVIQDGPFTCIDPYGRSGLSLMGNVDKAIHHQNIGFEPEIPERYRPLLNKGVIARPTVTRVKEFLEDAEVFFPGLSRELEHIGSMFTVRTVLPYREHDDARPTIVKRIGDRLISVFSGKIPHCVEAAEKVLELVRNHG